MIKTLLSGLAVTIVAAQTCNIDSDCPSANSCCMVEDDGMTMTQMCRSRVVLNSPNYDVVTKVLQDAQPMIMYCIGNQPRSEEAEENMDYPTFPYPVPKPVAYETKRDIMTGKINSDMFYNPTVPQDALQQLEKLLWLFVTVFIPFFDLFFYLHNVWNWFVDLGANLFPGRDHLVFPTMYRNPVAAAVLEEPAWVFKYWDLFSTQGFNNYITQKIALVTMPYIHLTDLIIKLINDDYSDWWAEFYTNKNFGLCAGIYDFECALMPLILPFQIVWFILSPLAFLLYPFQALISLIDWLLEKDLRRAMLSWLIYIPWFWSMPFSRYVGALWWADPENRPGHLQNVIQSTDVMGYDCNGNQGYGLYCHCPSQGYNCGCQEQSKVMKTEVSEGDLSDQQYRNYKKVQSCIVNALIGINRLSEESALTVDSIKFVAEITKNCRYETFTEEFDFNKIYLEDYTLSSAQVVTMQNKVINADPVTGLATSAFPYFMFTDYVPKLVCTDNIGFTCDGTRVDGRKEWCREEGNNYANLNKKIVMNQQMQM